MHFLLWREDALLFPECTQVLFVQAYEIRAVLFAPGRENLVFDGINPAGGRCRKFPAGIGETEDLFSSPHASDVENAFLLQLPAGGMDGLLRDPEPE